MGRNAIPKIGEYRDGVKYYVERQENGGLCTLVKLTVNSARDVEEEYLATFFPDGEDESLFCAWFSGHRKGYKAGYEQAQKDIRKALGL